MRIRFGSRRGVLALGMATALVAMGCQTNTGTALDKKSVQGAILGGLAGAAAGRAIGGHESAATGITIGALSGAVAGGLIGHYLDQQEREIDAIPDANVERQGDRLVVVFPGDLLFDSGSAQLKPGAQERLRQLANTLQRYPDTRIVVKGHTDSVGSEEFNQRLSERRAESVRNYLVALGIDPSRITALGFGEQFPVASNATAAGRQQNRRVELEIVPIEERLRESSPQGQPR